MPSWTNFTCRGAASTPVLPSRAQASFTRHRHSARSQLSNHTWLRPCFLVGWDFVREKTSSQPGACSERGFVLVHLAPSSVIVSIRSERISSLPSSSVESCRPSKLHRARELRSKRVDLEPSPSRPTTVAPLQSTTASSSCYSPGDRPAFRARLSVQADLRPRSLDTSARSSLI